MICQDEEDDSEKRRRLIIIALIVALLIGTVIAVVWLRDNGYKYRLDAPPPLPYGCESSSAKACNVSCGG